MNEHITEEQAIKNLAMDVVFKLGSVWVISMQPDSILKNYNHEASFELMKL